MSSKLCPSHNFALIWPGLGACASTLFYRLLGSAQLENLNMILDQEFWVKSFGSSILDQEFWVKTFKPTILDQECWIKSFGSRVLGSRVLDQASWNKSFGSRVLDQEFWVKTFVSGVLGQMFWIKSLECLSHQWMKKTLNVIS